MERTFVMLKPDAVQRGLMGELISRLERCGLQLVAMKFMHISPELAGKHYGEHVGKPFYDKLVSYITSGPARPIHRILPRVLFARILLKRSAVTSSMPRTPPQVQTVRSGCSLMIQSSYHFPRSTNLGCMSKIGQ